jgi:hypothetical protein
MAAALSGPQRRPPRVKTKAPPGEPARRRSCGELVLRCFPSVTRDLQSHLQFATIAPQALDIGSRRCAMAGRRRIPIVEYDQAMSFVSSTPGAPADPTPEDEPPVEGSAGPIEPPAPVDEAAARQLQRQADLRLFVGANAGTFVRIADAVETRSPARNAICWPGFLFPAAWFLYRKMYAYAAITVVLPVFTSLIHVPYVVIQCIAFGFSILGGYGKRLYLARARKMIAEIRAAALDEESARETIARAGGVSRAGAVFGALLIAAFVSFAFLRS